LRASQALTSALDDSVPTLKWGFNVKKIDLRLTTLQTGYLWEILAFTLPGLIGIGFLNSALVWAQAYIPSSDGYVDGCPIGTEWVGSGYCRILPNKPDNNPVAEELALKRE
jgi:hypothetical protein